ncbi:permease prefix domain 1-containing protein [Microbacterium fluvii]|uniref:Permease prefix domain 1-containing protein n=1 Tax=Microbacterium fluvii TaxID=415215 RepID=A0ABW2HET3_9MICO|nr:permease prefix domain 1-containing protein [Microbacterium fluvii]MCU4673405.1 permease prefix domain 1-containing protein [Microbacterium fluvii]
MNETLTDRYVLAAMRTVPEAQRADLAAELRASIDDQIEARAESGAAREVAERAVLTDLGDPDKLAAGYTDRPLHLIGPRYYLEWWRLLKLLLWIVTPLAAFGIALGQTLSGAPIGAIIGSTVAGMLGVVVNLSFWTTLVFAIVERSAQGAKGMALPAWSLDQLPLPHERGATFGEMLASLIFLVIGAGVVLWDQRVGLVYVDGQWYSLLHHDLWPWWIAALLIVMAAEAVLQVVVYLRRRWTYGLAAFNAVLDAVVAIPAIWLLVEGRLLDPAFWIAVIPEDGVEVFGILSVIAGFGIAVIAIWDAIDAFLKARRS